MTDPEDDLFSDAMDRAVSMHHSVRHGALRNAGNAREQVDGETVARRAMAAGVKAFIEEIVGHPIVDARIIVWPQSETGTEP